MPHAFSIGDRVRVVNSSRQTSLHSHIGEEFTVTRVMFYNRDTPNRDDYVSGDDGPFDRGVYVSQIEMAGPVEPKTPSEVEARLAMYEALPNKTVAVLVIIEELQWVIGALRRAEATPDDLDTEASEPDEYYDEDEDDD